MRATYLDVLGENAAALESVERSLKLSDCDIPKRCKLRSYLNCVRSLPDHERAKLWLFCKLKAEQDMRRGAERSNGEVGDSTENGASSDGGGDRCKSDMVVERVKYADLSVEQFLGKPSNAVPQSLLYCDRLCRMYRRTIWFSSVMGSGIINFPDIAGWGEHQTVELRQLYLKENNFVRDYVCVLWHKISSFFLKKGV